MRYVFRGEPAPAADQPQVKACPFCAETIQRRAIKCRFCGEFLNTDKARAAFAQSDDDSQNDEEDDDSILFKGRPSLWGLAGPIIKGSIILALAVFLVRYPLENLSIFHLAETSVSTEVAPTEAITNKWGFTLTQQQTQLFGRIRVAVGAGLSALVVLILLMKMTMLKMTCYEVTTERIEWSRGILDRRVDNLDMFRVIDLRLRRSILDCIVGIGTVVLITKDQTDPEFAFNKIHQSRRLYDIIKRASLDADRKNNVIHLE